MAYRIKDTRAKGAIIVSPIGLQKGARLVAEKELVCEVRLTADSTTTDYVLQFLNKTFLGMSATVGFRASLGKVAIRNDGSREIVKDTDES